MAIYASHARGTRGVDLATLGAISAPAASLATNQIWVAQGSRPEAVPARQPKVPRGHPRGAAPASGR